ncbi:MAG TPA: CHAD domain-containing protein [Candidatus Tumulicola sp.]|nr:CHAD domain-containing protein [Candidatus Tumulicola sp.]
MARLSKVSTGEAFRQNFANAVERVRALQPRLQAGDDREDLHEARVAVRRLRSYLRTFEPVLEITWATSLRRRLERLNACLSEARDLDVLSEMVAGRDDTVPDRVATERLAKRRAAREELGHERSQTLLRDLDLAAERPQVRPEAQLAARRGVRALLARVWKRARRRVRRCGRKPADAELHRIRIAAKHVRYAAEVYGDLGAKSARALARHARRLQTVLGRHHDAVVAAARLQTLCELPPGTLGDAPRARWRPLWRKMCDDYRRLA